jgi:hypothetical protein
LYKGKIYVIIMGRFISGNTKAQERHGQRNGSIIQQYKGQREEGHSIPGNFKGTVGGWGAVCAGSYPDTALFHERVCG